MAQLLLSAVQIFCGVPAAPIVGPLLAACIPVNLINIASFVGWFFGIKYSKAKWLARFKGTTKTMLKWAFLFHLLTVVPIYFLIIMATCHAVG